MAKARTPVSKKTWKNKTFNTNLAAQRQQRLERERQKTEQNKKNRYKVFIRSIGAIVAGKTQRKSLHEKKVYNAFWSAVIKSMFTSIYLAYNRKVTGASDELGNSWVDLSPYTKAYKKDRRGRLTRGQRVKLNKTTTPGLLTPAQYKRWKKDFAESFNQSMTRIKKPSPQQMRDSEIAAAKFAWYNAKRKGAETLLDVLGKQQYPIMHETGKLHESFRPGKIRANFGGRLAYKPRKDQVARVEDGVATIGTSVPYATLAEGPVGDHHRPLWPENIDTWYEIAIDAGRSAIIKQINEITKIWK